MRFTLHLLSEKDKRYLLIHNWINFDSHQQLIPNFRVIYWSTLLTE